MSHQLSLDSHGDNFKIIDKEFLEGTQLFVIREVDTGIELNIKVPEYGKFEIDQVVGVKILSKNVNKMLE